MAKKGGEKKKLASGKCRAKSELLRGTDKKTLIGGQLKSLETSERGKIEKLLRSWGMCRRRGAVAL